jgi:uncharacterized protein YjaZ
MHMRKKQSMRKQPILKNILIGIIIKYSGGFKKKGGVKMGVIQTDEWLKAAFDRPLEICKKLVPYFKGQNEREIYQELMKFGLYQPSRSSHFHLNFMLEQELWKKIEQIFQRYRNKWGGPDIPIFMFPLAQTRGWFTRQDSTKSGVSYPDKMFLFTSKLDDEKELEALFVHEYHHVCRLNQFKKKMEHFTLLDSIIIEGLAEYAVLKNCGPNYLAKWCSMYSGKELTTFWEKYVQDQLNVKKNERLHDEILYGGGRIPKLLGYASGFKIVENFYKRNHYSTKLSFSISSEKYLENKNLFD